MQVDKYRLKIRTQNSLKAPLHRGKLIWSLVIVNMDYDIAIVLGAHS